MRSRILFVFCASLLGVLTLSGRQVLHAGQQPAGTVAAHRALLEQYCFGCHDSDAQVAGLSLEDFDLNDVSQHPETWEKVIRKLRGRMMPPAGARSPETPAMDSLATFLEASLDGATSETHTGPKVLHRLNRYEYGNAIRDLLGLDVDPRDFLPPDVDAFGFDNMAEVLGISPTLMERYLAAAWKITGWAIGDTGMTPSVETFRVPPDLSQHDHIDGLPIGTRGGVLIDYTFPVDGEYVIKPKLWRNTVELIRGLEQQHDLEITFDGERVLLARFGGFDDELPNYLIPKAEGDKIEERFQIRLPVTAGPHSVGVAFLKKSSASTLNLMQPFIRERIDPIDPTGIPVLDRVTVEGPFDVTGAGNSLSRRRIFSCYPTVEDEAPACAREILSTLARRAYRRPLTGTELDDLIGFYEREREKGKSFDTGVQTALVYVLVSPQFLFRMERDPVDMVPGAAYPIGDLDMAARLSFFIWSSIPDDELLELAIAGQLQEPAILERQVRRMLADERAAALGANFAGQWLYLRNVESTTPDSDVFPDFDDNLRKALQRETELLFETIVREDRPLPELLTSDYTFINERLARHYGLPNVYGNQFRRVQIEDEYRKGLLGQGSIMLINSYANRTSPVTRGKYVLTNILGTPPPPPPANVPPLNEDRGVPLTMRQRMEQHRDNPACSGCHALMDPIGLALENFDGIGRWRLDEDDVPIDSSGVIHVLREFGPIGGPVELRQAILGRSEQFVRTGTEMLLTYALGRGLEPGDMPIVRSIVRDAAADDYRFSSLVLGVVRSGPFRLRMAQPRESESIARNTGPNLGETR